MEVERESAGIRDMKYECVRPASSTGEENIRRMIAGLDMSELWERQLAVRKRDSAHKRRDGVRGKILRRPRYLNYGDDDDGS